MKTTDATKEELLEYFLGPKSRRIGYTTEERDRRFLVWLCRKRSRALFDELDKIKEQQNAAREEYIKKFAEFTTEKDPAKKFELCQEATDIGLKLQRLEGQWHVISQKIDEL